MLYVEKLISSHQVVSISWLLILKINFLPCQCKLKTIWCVVFSWNKNLHKNSNGIENINKTSTFFSLQSLALTFQLGVWKESPKLHWNYSLTQRGFHLENPSSDFHSKFLTQYKCQGLNNPETQRDIYLKKEKNHLINFRTHCFVSF